MTQTELANILNVTKNTIQKYESNDVPNIKVETLRELSNLFGISPRAFIFPEELRNFNLETILLNEIRMQNHIETVLQLNEIGIVKVLEYAEDLLKSGNYSR